jgi:MFS transporter, ACS family, tartrate transporter
MPDTPVSPQQLYRKLSWRLLPYLFLLYIFAYLDRANVGFAAVSFKQDLHLSETVYGVGAAVYFLGQFLFDLPSNLLLQKVGPRLWITRIMVTWGIVATGMMFVQGEHSFYGMRLLLGISEAGFFPGIILYLTYWFPSQERAKAVAGFMTATSIAGVVGAELSRILLGLEGRAHLHGWQWLFLCEGVPTVLLGISVLFLLPDHPDAAPWLQPGERRFLDHELERDRQEGGAAQNHHLLDAFKLPMVWVLALLFALDQLAVYTITLWMPSVIAAFLHTDEHSGAALVGRYAALPYLAAAACTVLIGWSSDRTGERRLHIAGCLLLAAAGFAWAAFAHSLPASLLAFVLATVGCFALMGPFWSLPTRVLGGQAAAGGVAIITMVGSLGGFAGPALTGKLKDLTHTYTAGFLLIAALAVLAASLCFLLPAQERKAGRER